MPSNSLPECGAHDLLVWRHPQCGYPEEGNVTPTTHDDKQNKEVTGEPGARVWPNLELDAEGEGF